jgi:hypothetical protein
MEESAMKVVLMVDFFQKVKKRMPRHLREVKDFLSGLGYPVELSEFRELKLVPVALKKLLIEYSVFTGENEWTPSRRMEMTTFREEFKDKVLSKLKLKHYDPDLVEELCFS